MGVKGARLAWAHRTRMARHWAPDPDDSAGPPTQAWLHTGAAPGQGTVSAGTFWLLLTLTLQFPQIPLGPGNVPPDSQLMVTMVSFLVVGGGSQPSLPGDWEQGVPPHRVGEIPRVPGPTSPQWGRPALPGPPGHSRPHAEIPGSGHLECSFLTRRHWAGVPLRCEPLTSVGAPGAPTIAGLGGVCPLSVVTALLAPLSLQRCETIMPGARPGVTVKAAWSSGSCLGIWAGHHLPTWC